MKKIYCDIKKCLGCGSCEIACSVEHSKSKKLADAKVERIYNKFRNEKMKNFESDFDKATKKIIK